jgi:hypothetical protein
MTYPPGILLSLVVQTKYKTSNKKITCMILGLYAYHFIIWNNQQFRTCPVLCKLD